MSSEYIKAFAVIILCAIMGIMFKNMSLPFSVLLSAFVSLCVGVFCLSNLSPFLDFLAEINSGTPFGAYSGILVKVCGIGIITRLTAELCRDSGENSYATKAELIGNTAVLLCALPVIKSIFEQIKEFLN